MKKKQWITLGAILKNEANYVVEWIAYHKAIGFDEIVIADNISDDGTSEILKCLNGYFGITAFDYPTTDLNPKPQIFSYEEIIKSRVGISDWVAIVDGDEFIYPAFGSNINDFLLCFDSRKVGAIALNWQIVGSANRLNETAGRVIDRFNFGSGLDNKENKHYKSIVNPKAFISSKNPHSFIIDGSYDYLSSNGTSLSDGERNGRMSIPTWEGARVLHYVIKSREEFFNKKQPRGYADGHSGRLDNFFDQFDCNDQKINFPNHLLENINIWENRLNQVLKKNRVEVKYPNSAPIFVNNMGFQGVVDNFLIDDGVLYLKGWRRVVENRCKFRLVVNDSLVITLKHVNSFSRKDVADKIKMDEVDFFGFEASLDISTLNNLKIKRIDVYCGGDDLENIGSRLEFSDDKKKNLINSI